MKLFRRKKKRRIRKEKATKVKKHYTGVRQQQGRVTLDDDWNEDTN